MTEAAAAPAVRRRPGSPVARAALLAYLLLIVYASWYPFAGWRNTGLSPLAYVYMGMPRYYTLFDVAVNVVGYIPLGTLLVLALHPQVKGVWGLLLAALLGSFVSGTMEAVQTFLPSRVPSNLDFFTNSAGALIGAGIGALGVRTWLDQSRLYHLRRAWFGAQAGPGLVLLALWPLAQIYPQAYLFGHGGVLTILSDWLSSWFDTSIDLVAMLHPGAVMSVEQYWLSETIITACGLTGAVLTLLSMMRREAPRAALMVAMLAAALVMKSLASSLLFTPDNAFVWVTPGAQGGFLIGLIMIGGLAFAPQLAQRRLAVATLLISLLVVNMTPVNPYFSATLQGWVQGKFLNFNGAAQFLSLLWPFFALWFLLLPSHRRAAR
jgi:VanZ family protein